MGQFQDRLAGARMRTLAGTPSEIGRKLQHVDAERAIALTFAQGSEDTMQAIARALSNLAPMVAGLAEQRQHDLVDQLVQALVPAVLLPEHMQVEARMTAQARAQILGSGDWLTAAQLAGIASFSTSNPSAQPNKWKKDGRVFAIRHQGLDYFPGYGLDAKAGYRPLKMLAKSLAVFGTAKDGWGLACWFALVNGFLGGRRAQDALLESPELVLEAAADETAEIAHG